MAPAAKRLVGSGTRPEGCALVTGGGRGIGAAISRSLADDSWPVVVNYRSDADSAAAVVAGIEADGGRAVALGGDVADPEAAAALVPAAAEALGMPVLALVNNAGVRADDLTLSIDDEAWDHVLDTNLGGAFRLTRSALRGMIRARHGRVVNVASIVGIRANAGQANYAAAKAGLVGLTRTVAVEVARRGVTVNAIAPGFIDTDMTSDPATGAPLPEAVVGAIPARRAGSPEEVAACVRFLASTQASYVTGSVLVVDGGLSA
jgi:3-oxoacyl-[acyl-carrier protein] reductase